MFYIPKDWLKDENNEKAVHNILEQYLGNSNLKLEGFENDVELAFKELEKIRETTIVEKIKDGTLINC
jgi:hypothetical protein